MTDDEQAALDRKTREKFIAPLAEAIEGAMSQQAEDTTCSESP